LSGYAKLISDWWPIHSFPRNFDDSLEQEMIAHLLIGIVAGMLTAAAVVSLSDQCRKPRWWLGRLYLWDMNRRHSKVTDWGLQHISLEKRFTVLDVGCGGGRTIQKLAAAAAEGKVYGIDYSAASVAAARRTNAGQIAEGRVDIQQGSVSHLPFRDGTFDVVTAVETHYYWPNLAEDLREIRRVLNPGGRFVVIAETYKGRRFDVLYWPAMKLLRANYLSANEHRELFSAAGFSEIKVMEQAKKGWICVVGRRPLT
jgi:SAM-dependent methyltransferase